MHINDSVMNCEMVLLKAKLSSRLLVEMVKRLEGVQEQKKPEEQPCAFLQYPKNMSLYPCSIQRLVPMILNRVTCLYLWKYNERGSIVVREHASHAELYGSSLTRCLD